MSIQTHTEAVGIFHDATSLRTAADDLMINGFDRADLSVLAGEAAVERQLGHAYQTVLELLDDPRVATHAYTAGDSLTEAEAATVGGLGFIGAAAAAGTVVASDGTLSAAITGALVAGGVGAVIGAVLARLMGRRHARMIKRQLDKGGMLLWVRTVDSTHEQRALEILKANGAEDAHLHELPQASFGGKLQIYGYLHWLGDLPSRLRAQF